MTGTGFAVRYRTAEGAEETATPRRAIFVPFEDFSPWRQPKPYKAATCPC